MMMTNHFLKYVQSRAILSILACGLFLVSACSDGDVGPQGEKGETGAAGEAGADGADGADDSIKLGYFEGTVTGIHRDDDSEFSEDFKYEYSEYDYETLDSDRANFYRLGTPTDQNLYLYIALDYSRDGNEITSPEISYYSFSIEKELSASSLFIFYAISYSASNNSEITNFSYDDETGIVTFDFSITIASANSTGKAATISGSFNSGGRVYDEG